MGVYNYILTTKSRKYRVLGTEGKVDIHLIKFSDKEHFWAKTPPHLSAKIARLDNAWARRPSFPAYATHEIEDSIEVMERNIAGGYRYPVYGNMNRSYFSEGYFAAVELAGYLVVRAGKIVFERWHCVYVSMPDAPRESPHANVTKLLETMKASGLIGSEVAVRKMPQREGHPYNATRENFAVCFQRHHDLIRSKLVLSDMEGLEEYSRQAA